MSQELLYTSSQKGLDPTKRGFCTVLATAGMPSNLSGQLERLSGYKHHFPAGSDEAHQNPVAFSHVTLRINGRVTSVLSRVSDYKLDYSGRSNKLAHHVVLDHSERCDAGPAWLLQQHDLMRTEWDGECKNVTHGPIIPMGHQRPALCRTWENVTGDAGHAGQIADAVQQSHKPIWIIYSLSQANQLLDLLNEVIALVPDNERWNTTFSTFFGQDSPDVTCKIRCVVENSDLARMAPSKGIVFSLTHPKSIINPTPTILAARGVETSAESFEPNILPSSTESIHQIDSSPHVDSTPAPTVNKEQSPPPLPSTTQKREGATSRERIATAAIVSPRPVVPPPAREFQQTIKSPTNWKPIVLTSVVTAAVVTLIFSAGITAYVWLGPNSKTPLAQNTDTESTETGVELDLSKEQPLQSSTGSAASSSAEDSVESTDNAEDQAPSGKDKPPTTETTSRNEDSTADAASDAEDKKEIDNDSPALSDSNAKEKPLAASVQKSNDSDKAETLPSQAQEEPNAQGKENLEPVEVKPQTTEATSQRNNTHRESDGGNNSGRPESEETAQISQEQPNHTSDDDQDAIKTQSEAQNNTASESATENDIEELPGIIKGVNTKMLMSLDALIWLGRKPSEEISLRSFRTAITTTCDLHLLDRSVETLDIYLRNDNTPELTNKTNSRFSPVRRQNGKDEEQAQALHATYGITQAKNFQFFDPLHHANIGRTPNPSNRWSVSLGLSPVGERTTISIVLQCTNGEPSSKVLPDPLITYLKKIHPLNNEVNRLRSFWNDKDLPTSIVWAKALERYCHIADTEFPKDQWDHYLAFYDNKGKEGVQNLLQQVKDPAQRTRLKQNAENEISQKRAQAQQNIAALRERVNEAKKLRSEILERNKRDPITYEPSYLSFAINERNREKLLTKIELGVAKVAFQENAK